MKFQNVQCILTDIEGTTTSISFVYDILFPYFRKHLPHVKDLLDQPEVQAIFEATKALSLELDHTELHTVDEVLATLTRWSMEDRKVTPLKELQGIIWKEGYLSGAIKGHVYDEVEPCLVQWKSEGKQLGVFSSGSIAAQKLLFGNSIVGDLTPHFSCYFDTTTGPKRQRETYEKIATQLTLPGSAILFLSDIVEELVAADAAGFQTVQLIRNGQIPTWNQHVTNFNEIAF